jgi:hypothetical protein
MKSFLLIIIFASPTSYSRDEIFTMTQAEIEAFKIELERTRDERLAKAKDLNQLKSETLEKHKYYSEIKFARNEIKRELDSSLKKDLKTKGKKEKIKDDLYECMLNTFEGKKSKVIPSSKSDETASSPKECYQKNKSAKELFEKEFQKISSPTDSQGHFSNLKKLSELSLNADETNLIQRGRDHDDQISKLDNEVKQIELKMSEMWDMNSRILKLQIRVNFSERCAANISINNNRLLEIQEKSNSEISSMEDLLYSSTKCLKAKIDKKLVGNSYCERYKFFIENKICTDEYYESNIEENFCNTNPNKIPKEFLNIQCFLNSTSNAKECLSIDLNEKPKETLKCSTHDLKLEKPLAFNKEGVSKARRFIGDKIARGIPVIGSIKDKHIGILGIKNDQGQCKYLVRDFTGLSERWVDEDDILNNYNEFHFLEKN